MLPVVQRCQYYNLNWKQQCVQITTLACNTKQTRSSIYLHVSASFAALVLFNGVYTSSSLWLCWLTAVQSMTSRVCTVLEMWECCINFNIRPPQHILRRLEVSGFNEWNSIKSIKTALQNEMSPFVNLYILYVCMGGSRPEISMCSKYTQSNNYIISNIFFYLCCKCFTVLEFNILFPKKYNLKKLNWNHLRKTTSNTS